MAAATIGEKTASVRAFLVFAAVKTVAGTAKVCGGGGGASCMGPCGGGGALAWVGIGVESITSRHGPTEGVRSKDWSKKSGASSVPVENDTDRGSR